MLELGEVKAPFSSLSSHQLPCTPKAVVGTFGREAGSFPEKGDVEILCASSGNSKRNRINSRTICLTNTDIEREFKWIICFESWMLVKQVIGTGSSHRAHALNNNSASAITYLFLHDTIIFSRNFLFSRNKFCICYYATTMLRLRKISLAMSIFQTRN